MSELDIVDENVGMWALVLACMLFCLEMNKLHSDSGLEAFGSLCVHACLLMCVGA